MKKRVFIMVAVLALMGAMTATPAAASTQRKNRPVREKNERHPMIRRAIAALRGAKDDLEDASRDFCGHRAEAAEAVNNALSQLQLALGSDRASVEPMENVQTGVRFEKASWNSSAVKGERHPKIRQAIRALERAKGDLQNAAHDFHGHREAALDATNRALSQLQAAVACDRK